MKLSPPLVGGVRGGVGLERNLTNLARNLRNNPTEAEKQIWYMLRQKISGVKFRRQGVIGQYIVDFVCFEKRLIIEIDGGQHAENESDKVRDKWLRSEGFEVLRFWNQEVLNNRQGVLENIFQYLNPPALTLPTEGEGNNFV